MFAYIFFAVSIVTFLVWGYDKFRAKNGGWRIPERTLLLLSVLGGSFGALAGMLVFRHKTRKSIFWVIVGLACVIHIIALISLR